MTLSYNRVIVFVDGNPISANVAGSVLLCSASYISEAWKVQRLYTPRETFHLRSRFHRLVGRSTSLISITSTIEAYSIAAHCSHPTKIRFTEYSLETRALSDLDFCPPPSNQKATLNGHRLDISALDITSITHSYPLRANFYRHSSRPKTSRKCKRSTADEL